MFNRVYTINYKKNASLILNSQTDNFKYIGNK